MIDNANKHDGIDVKINEGEDEMKKAIIENICCEGCAKDVKHVLENIYGVSSVSVSCEGGYALFDGFVSTEVIKTALADEGYHLVDIVKHRES